MESDYLLLLDGNQQNVGYTVPAKIFEYIRVGRPILAVTSPESPVDRILDRSGVPFVCIYPHDSTSDVDLKLSGFFRLSNQPRPASAWFREQFDGERQAAQLGNILEKILGPSNE